MGLNVEFKDFCNILSESELCDLIEQDEDSLQKIYEYIETDFDNTEAEEQYINEALSFFARQKRSRDMKRRANLLQVRKMKQANKAVTNDEVQQKTRKNVINTIKKGLAKGKEHLTHKEKVRIEKIIATPHIQRKIDRLVRKNFKANKEVIKSKRQSIKGIEPTITENTENNKMGKFKKFILENEDKLSQIRDILTGMYAEEIDDFGAYLLDAFFDDLPDDEYEYEITLEDVMEMIKELGIDFYDEILHELSEIGEDEYEEEDDEEDEEMDEAVSRLLRTKNYNKKKRNYMSTSKAELRRTKSQRKKDARKTKSQRKRYYKANKQKIAAYQKSRREAIKKGKHKPKERRSS